MGVAVILLRLLLILTAIAIGVSLGLYVLTNDSRYLRYIRQTLRFVVFALLIIGVLYLLERLVLVAA